MPLQQIQLDQSIYNKQKPKWGASRQPQRSPISEALTPQPTGGATAEQRYAPGFVERQKEEWAKEDKLKKAERDRKVEEAQEIGMRIRGAHQAAIEKGKAQSAKVEADVEAMAMEAYKFAVDEELDEASRQNILRALKAKPKAYDFLMKKGLIMADGSDFVRKAGEPIEPYEADWSIQEGFIYDKNAPTPTFYEMPEKEAEKFDPTQIQELTDSQGNKYFMYKGKVLTPSTKPQVGRYQLTSEGVLDTATNTMDVSFKKGASDEDKLKDMVDGANKFGIDIAKATENKITVQEARYDYYIKLQFSPEDAKIMAQWEDPPVGIKKEGLFTRIKNRLTGGGKTTPPPTVTGAGKGAYREDAVTALIPLMEGVESLTAVHYDQWTKQGATKAEIDEAFKRVKGEK